jgi:hypothetical protein
MKSLSSVFWILILVLLFYVGFKIVPIYYRGVIGIRGICKENADLYHKYRGSNFIPNEISDKLQRIGIPKDKSEFTIEHKSDSVVIWIAYEDEATFLDRYTKEFVFETECEGVLKSVY